MVDFIIPMYIPLLVRYSSYIQAVKRHLKNEQNFEDFLQKEAAERLKYYGSETTYTFPTTVKIFIPLLTVVKNKMYDGRRLKFINKFHELRPNILKQMLQQVLTHYKTKLEAISDGTPLQNLIDEFENAEKTAVEELEKKTRMASDSQLWKQAKKQLQTEIEKIKKSYNQPLFVCQDERIGNSRQELHKTSIDASEVQVDMSNIGLLGQGGFGQVRVGYIEYRGPVAVKVPKTRGSIQVNIEIFIQEIKLMLYANHENIVQVVGYTLWNNAIAMIMEYMPGGNLKKLLLDQQGGGQFSVPNIPDPLRRRFCFDISSGVTYLHFAFSDQRVVHGDLKPSNILLTSDLRCKIGDFGGADVATCSDQLNTMLIQESLRQWTHGFIAPERLNNPQHRVSRAMDVYSVGMIFYVILSRHPPSNDVHTNKEKITQFCQQPNQEALKRLTLQCTDHNHLMRPSMLQVRNELQTLLHNEDSAEIGQNVADMLKSYKCKTSIGSPATWPILANVNNF